MSSDPKRLWELDLVRGVAILMMVAFHTLFDLDYLGAIHLDLYSGPLFVFALSIGTMFLLLVGISLTLSYQRTSSRLTAAQLRGKYVRRGAGIFALGMGVTLVTWIVIPGSYVVFGILHCIGISIILAYPLITRPRTSVVLAFAVILTGLFLYQTVFRFPWLLWMGLRPMAFDTVDYFPLFPWFGVVLIGVTVGNVLYPHGRRRATGGIDEPSAARPLSFLGRHSLLIYLIHQPIILAIITIVTLV